MKRGRRSRGRRGEIWAEDPDGGYHAWMKRMPRRRLTLHFFRRFTHAEMDLIRPGLYPESMDDKWVVLKRGRFIDFFRSWTKHHIYRLTLWRIRGGTIAGPLIVNGDPRHYRREAFPGGPEGIDDEDRESVNELLDWTMEANRERLAADRGKDR